jgi:hypothetical protein
MLVAGRPVVDLVVLESPQLMAIGKDDLLLSVRLQTRGDPG